MKISLDSLNTRNYLVRMKNDEKAKRSTVKLSDAGDRKVDVIKGTLLAQHGVRASRDDVIDRIIVESDAKAIIKAMSGGVK